MASDRNMTWEVAVRFATVGEAEAARSVAAVRAGEFYSHEHTRRNWRRELAPVSRVIERGSYGHAR